jgi:predicted regulator of Ras-like GTPase activity (Roadblock/LC7/MglB family)
MVWNMILVGTSYSLFTASGQKSGNLEQVLKDLQTSVPEIVAAIVVSIEGLPIASALPKDVDETKVAAMTAAMLSLGERASSELGKGEIEQIFVKGKEGYIIAIGAGANAVLTVSARKDVKIGLIFIDLKRAADQVAGLV